MDIIYTSFLEVYHKEVSPQTSFRLSHHFQLRLKATAMQHLLLLRAFLCGHDNPSEDTGTPSGIRAGGSHLRLILTSSESLGAYISDGNIPRVFN